MVFYGDDMIESWRGSAGGADSAACAGIPEMWKTHFGDRFRAQAYGIAGKCR